MALTWEKLKNAYNKPSFLVAFGRHIQFNHVKALWYLKMFQDKKLKQWHRFKRCFLSMVYIPGTMLGFGIVKMSRTWSYPWASSSELIAQRTHENREKFLRIPCHTKGRLSQHLTRVKLKILAIAPWSAYLILLISLTSSHPLSPPMTQLQHPSSVHCSLNEPLAVTVSSGHRPLLPYICLANFLNSLNHYLL